MSIPREAMSVATSTGVLFALKFASARWRAFWLLLPWIASARMPRACRCRTTRSAPCLVRVKTIARVIGRSFTRCASSTGLFRFSTK